MPTKNKNPSTERTISSKQQYNIFHTTDLATTSAVYSVHCNKPTSQAKQPASERTGLPSTQTRPDNVTPSSLSSLARSPLFIPLPRSPLFIPLVSFTPDPHYSFRFSPPLLIAALSFSLSLPLHLLVSRTQFGLVSARLGFTSSGSLTEESAIFFFP